ncbi:MAG: hypothetical protein RLY86_54 [Pseudomonadota bacterium]|jgi:hypothetical protein
MADLMPALAAFPPPVEDNLRILEQELDWFGAWLRAQLESYLSAEPDADVIRSLPPPDLAPDGSALGRLVHDWVLGLAERIAIALTLAPHLRPDLLDMLLLTSSQTGRVITEFGGVTEGNHRGFLPSGQTLAFLLSACHRPDRRDFHRLMREQVLWLEGENDRLPRIANPLRLSEAWLHYLVTGEPARPETEQDFPARPITCAQAWGDLILDPQSMAQLNEIRPWLRHGAEVMSTYRLAGKVKPGYRALFFGPPSAWPSPAKVRPCRVRPCRPWPMPRAATSIWPAARRATFPMRPGTSRSRPRAGSSRPRRSTVSP